MLAHNRASHEDSRSPGVIRRQQVSSGVGFSDAVAVTVPRASSRRRPRSAQARNRGWGSASGDAGSMGIGLCWDAGGRARGRHQGRGPGRDSVRERSKAAWRTYSGRPADAVGEHRMREIDARGEPADWIGIVAVRSPSHEVSILSKTGVGRCLGCAPRSNISMMIMRLPQQGQARV